MDLKLRNCFTCKKSGADVLGPVCPNSPHAFSGHATSPVSGDGIVE